MWKRAAQITGGRRGADAPRLFDVVLADAAPDADLLKRAVERLAAILVLQAQLRIDEVTQSRDRMVAELHSDASRVLRIDLERAEALLANLRVIRDAPRQAAEERLQDALSLVGGPLTCIELGADVIGARLRSTHGGARRTRALLLPTPASRMRLQLQVLDGSNADTLRGAAPRCYGRTAVDYYVYALNRFDLRTLFLVAAGYVRMNRAAV